MKMILLWNEKKDWEGKEKEERRKKGNSEDERLRIILFGGEKAKRKNLS